MKTEQVKDSFLRQIIQLVGTEKQSNIVQISIYYYSENLLLARFEELIAVNGLLCLAE